MFKGIVSRDKYQNWVYWILRIIVKNVTIEIKSLFLASIVWTLTISQVALICAFLFIVYLYNPGCESGSDTVITDLNIKNISIITKKFINLVNYLLGSGSARIEKSDSYPQSTLKRSGSAQHLL